MFPSSVNRSQGHICAGNHMTSPSDKVPSSILQKIVSQKSGIQAYIDINKQVTTGSISRQVRHDNKSGVFAIVCNVRHNMSIHHNPQLRIEFLSTLLFMATVDRHPNHDLRALLLWSVKEGTGKSTTLKIIPESIRKTMVTDAVGVGANNFKTSENVFVLDDVNVRDITNDKRGVIWALATGSTTSVKIHSSSRKITPKWVIATSNENIPEALDQMKRGTPAEQLAVRGMQSRFMSVEFYKQHRGTNSEMTIQIDDDARMQLLIEVMKEIGHNPLHYQIVYQRNIMHALYMAEAGRVLEEQHSDHPLFKTAGYREVIEGLINHVEEVKTNERLQENDHAENLELVMTNISKKLGMHDDAKEAQEKQQKIERAQQQFEHTLQDIAASEGIDFEALLSTPMAEEVSSKPVIRLFFNSWYTEK